MYTYTYIYIHMMCMCVWTIPIYVFFLLRLLCLIDRYFCFGPGFQIVFMHGGTGVTLVPVLTNTARCHSDIKGRRPFHVPAVFYPFCFDRHGMGPSREPLHRFFHFCMVSAICSSYCGRHGILNPLAVAKALALAMVTLPTRLVFPWGL